MRLVIEIAQEVGDRWIAEIPSLPGVLAYGRDRSEAVKTAKVLALRVLADQLEHGELSASIHSIVFSQL